jgi:muramoyltetrapeptide carboxypeptidase LdcA involved in peptidoglycan recycling
MASQFPHRVQSGINAIKSIGFNIQIGKSAMSKKGFVPDTPQNRANDINDFFGDPKIKGIFCTIGGDHACELLPLLDYKLIRKNPKVFMGYSDISVLNIAIWQQTGLVTFNGPMVMMDFAEYPRMFDYTTEYFLRTLCEKKPIGQIKPSTYWTEERLEWKGMVDQSRARHLIPSEGWRWIKKGAGKGKLVGGCLESLQHLRGTDYWPDWSGTIFFWETSSQKPSPAFVDSILADYENMGIFRKISGMLVGRSVCYTSDEKQQLEYLILNRLEKYGFPIITDLDFGHTTPQITIPLGCTAYINSENFEFSIVDSCVC